MTEPTRGERNNNPGNIVYTPSVQYVGQLGIETLPPGEHYAPRFARFDTPQNGIRALCVLLKVYYQRHGLHDVDGIISRWAPTSDHNPTAAYVDNVCRDMGVGPGEMLTLDVPTWAKLATAIIRQENERVIYPPDMIVAAAQNALGTVTPEVSPKPRSVALPPIPEPHAAVMSQPLPAPSVGLWQKIRGLCGWGRE